VSALFSYQQLLLYAKEPNPDPRGKILQKSWKQHTTRNWKFYFMNTSQKKQSRSVLTMFKLQSNTKPHFLRRSFHPPTPGLNRSAPVTTTV